MGCRLRTAEIIPLKPDPGNAGVGKKSSFFSGFKLNEYAMKHIVLLLLVLIIPFESVFSEEDQRWRVSGKITDGSGKPISGAAVILEGTYIGAYSGIDGTYNIGSVREDNYSVIVSHIGYTSITEEISVRGDTEADFVLTVSTVMADEVVVRGIRASASTPVAHTEIGKEEIVRNNTGQDLPYLLALQPSVVETSEAGTGIGYTGLRIRGSDASRINVTLDGIPLNDSESQQVFWVNMPDLAASVSGIQVQRGVGTSTNGAGAFGGSINMTLENPSDDPYVALSSSIGSYGTAKGSVNIGTGYLRERFKLDLRFSGVTSDGYIDRAKSEHRALTLSGLYRMKNSILKANFLHGEEVTGISWWGVPADSLETNRTYNPAGEYTDNQGTLRYYDDQNDNYVQTHLHLIYNWQINDRLLLKTAGHFTRGAGYYEQYKENQKLSDYDMPNWILHGMFEDVILDRSDLIRRKWLYNFYYGGVFNLNWTGPRLDVSFGGALNSYTGDHYGRVIWMRFAGNTERDYQWYLNGGQKNEFNIYGKVNYRINDRFSAYGDLQYRFIDYLIAGYDDDLRYLYVDQNFNFFNPKAGILARLNSHHSLYLSFAMANREPTRANYKDASGDDEAMPQPERMYDFESGYTFSYSIVTASLNLYYMYYDDQLVPTGKLSSVGYPIMTNVDRSYRAGAELTAGVKPFDKLEWQGGVTISRNIIRNFTEYSQNYNSLTDQTLEIAVPHGDVTIAYSPSLVANSVISYSPLKSFDIKLVTKYVGKQYFDNTMSESRSIDPYLVNNLRFDYTVSIPGFADAGIQFQVNNVLNKLYVSNAYGGNWYEDMREYTWAYYFPQAPRNYLVRLTLSF